MFTVENVTHLLHFCNMGAREGADAITPGSRLFPLLCLVAQTVVEVTFLEGGEVGGEEVRGDGVCVRLE